MRYFLATIFTMLFSLSAWSQTRIIPHVTSPTGGFTTRVLVINSGDAPAAYQLIAIDADGQESSRVQGTLTAGKTFSANSAELFENAEVSYLRIEADEVISVFAEYKTTGIGSPAQVNESATQAPRWQFFPGDWSTVLDAFAVVNSGDAATDIVVRQMDPTGIVVAEETAIVGLQPNRKGLALVDGNNFTLGDGDYFQVEGEQPLAFIGLRFNQPSSTFFWEMPAVPLEKTPPAKSGKQAVTVLFTNDEHGWMEATDTHSGAAGMMGQWRSKEGYTEEGPFLIVSGGDMWTGPAISSWTEGESMAEVMNALQYDVAAIGNHEFDFGIETLGERQSESIFPFLSANIREKATGQRPAFAKPFTIFDVHGVNVGVIGLTTVQTPTITFPTITGPYEFIDYETALRETVPKVRQHGADVILVTAHTCTVNLLPLADTFAELGLTMVAGGHCNHKRVEFVQGIPVVEANSFLRFYGKIHFDYDFDTGGVAQIDAELVENNGTDIDADVQAVVDFWKQETDGILNQVIGYTENGIQKASPAMGNMVTDSWLIGFPENQIAITNGGSIRQDIAPGEITRGDILGLMPFENFLYELKLTGEEILANVDCCFPLLGGMTRANGGMLLDGTPLDPNEVYGVLTTDFLYLGGGGYLFGQQDPNPFDTGLNYREPLIEWILSLDTSPANPLDNYLNHTER